MRKKVRKVFTLILVLFRYLRQYIRKPFPQVHSGCLAATKQRVHYCLIFSCVIVIAKQLTLSSFCQWSDVVLDKITNDPGMANKVIPCQTVE
jgi:hypothetical protein